jgi:WD40 repeat protein
MYASSFAWTPDGTRLLSGYYHGSIREWDTSTWQQIRVGDPWTGHNDYIAALAINPTGTLVASASKDKHVRLWRRSDRQNIAIFKHSDQLKCVAFSTDGKQIFSGGYDNKISEWEVPEDALIRDIPEVGSDSFSAVASHLSQGHLTRIPGALY